MKITIGELRCIIREVSGDCWGGSHPDETYNQELVDDDHLAKKSILVPDDVKKAIAKWMLTMGLAGTKKH